MTNVVAKAVNRRAFVSELLGRLPDALVVSGLGASSYDLFAAGDRGTNYYLWGAMGASTSLALGLALAQPDKSVLVLTGDGEQLMGIGSLGTVAVKQPPNLTIVVLDNGHFGETGMQRSHTSLGTDLVAVAKGFGIADSFAVDRLSMCQTIAEKARARAGTTFVRVAIEAVDMPRCLPPRDGAYVKNRFRAALGLHPF